MAKSSDDFDVLTFFIYVMAFLTAIVAGFAGWNYKNVGEASRKVKTELSNLRQLETLAKDPQLQKWLARERETTEVGGGQVTVTINPSFLNDDFFKNSFIETEFSTESTTPFDNVNPSAKFNDVPSDSTITAVTPDLGELNSPNNLDDFQFQTDGSANFVIPEPSTLALVGLGGLALIRRRRA